MQVGGSGNSAFELQGSITVDTSGLQSELSNAEASANSLSAALDDIDSVDVGVNVDGDGEVEGLQETISSLDNTEVDVNVGVEGEEDVSELSGSMDGIEDVDADVTASVDGGDDVEGLAGDLESVDGSFETTVDVTVDGASEVSDVASEVADIGTQAFGSEGGIVNLTDTIIGTLAGAATIAAIKSVASEIANLSNDIASNGDTIDKQSQVLGISRQAYQEWAYVMSQNGTSIQASGTAFRTLTNNIYDGSDKFKTALDTIGLSYDEISSMSTEDAFSAIVTAMQDAGDFANKEAVAMDLLGNRATALMPLLNGTADSTEDLKTAAEDLGLIMSDEDIDAAVSYTDALDTFQRTVDGIKNSLGAELLTPLTEAITGFTEFIKTITDESITDGLEKIRETYTTTMSDISATDAEATAIIDMMEALGDFEGMTEEQQAQWTQLKDRLLEIMPELGDCFDDQTGKIKGSADALKQAKDNLVEYMEQQALASAAQEQYNKLAEAAAELATIKVDAEVANRTAENMTEGIAQSMQTIAQNMGGTFFQAFQQSIREHTGENGQVDWTGVFGEGDFTVGALEGMGADSETIEMAAQLAQNVSDLASKEAEAAAKQEELTQKTEEYNAQAEQTAQWYETMTELYSTDIDTSSLDTATETVQTDAEASADAMEDMASGMNVSSGVASSLGSVSSTMSSGLSSIYTSVVSWVNSINSAISQIGSVGGVGTSGSSVKGKGYATGIDYVPADGSYYIHQGEALLTKTQADEWRSGNSGGSGITAKDLNSMAAMIADAVSNRPVSFSVGERELTTTIRNGMSRQIAARSNQVTSGVGQMRRR